MIPHSLQPDDAVTSNQISDLLASRILACGVVVNVLYKLGDVGDRITCKGNIDHCDPKFSNGDVSQLGDLVLVGEYEHAGVAKEDLCARVSSTIDGVIRAELVPGISLLESLPAKATVNSHRDSPVVRQAKLDGLAQKTRLANHGGNLSEMRLNTVVVSSESKFTKSNECVDVDMLPKNWSAFEPTLLLSDDVCKRRRLDRNDFAVDTELVLIGSDEEINIWRGHDSDRR